MEPVIYLFDDEIVGKVFGKLTVFSYFNKRNVKTNKSVKYCLCVCKCGNRCEVRKGNLYYGTTKSCGCSRKENGFTPKIIHGKCKTEVITYRSWQAMKNRCRYYNVRASKYYIDRGIKVCDRWLHFLIFWKIWVQDRL